MGHAAADAERIEHAGEELHGDEKRILPAMREAEGVRADVTRGSISTMPWIRSGYSTAARMGDLCAQAVPDKHGLLNAGVVQHPHQVGRMNLKRRLFAGLARTVSLRSRRMIPPASRSGVCSVNSSQRLALEPTP